MSQAVIPSRIKWGCVPETGEYFVAVESPEWSGTGRGSTQEEAIDKLWRLMNDSWALALFKPHFWRAVLEICT